MTIIVPSRRREKLTLVGWLRLFVVMVCISLTAAFAYYEWLTQAFGLRCLAEGAGDRSHRSL